jgi:hypothetical protein
MGALRKLAIVALAIVAGAVVTLAVGGVAAGGAAVAATKSPTVTAKIELAKNKVTVGKPVRGKLVLTNPGSQKVDLNTGCAPKWEIVLGTGKTAPPVAFSQECRVGPFPVNPGTNKLAFNTSTQQLRPGKYHAFLVSSDPSFPTAKPVPVTIAAAS